MLYLLKLYCVILFIAVWLIFFMTYFLSTHGGGVNDDDLISLYYQNICLAKCVLHPLMYDDDDDLCNIHATIYFTRGGWGWAYIVKCLKCVFPYWQVIKIMSSGKILVNNVESKLPLFKCELMTSQIFFSPSLQVINYVPHLFITQEKML